MQQTAGAALLEAFERVIVINLPERADRRREIDAQLRRLGLSLDHPAVVLFPAVRPATPGPFPSVGAHGCFLSHLAVLELIAGEGWHSALILEDDTQFGADAGTRLPDLVGRLAAEDWAIVYGFGAPAGIDVPGGTGGWIALPPERGVRMLHFVGVRGQVAAELAAYLRTMMARPPGHPDGGPMHVDGAYSWFRRARPELLVLALEPAIAVQRASRSDIAAPRWFDGVPGLRGAVALLRRWRNRWR